MSFLPFLTHDISPLKSIRSETYRVIHVYIGCKSHLHRNVAVPLQALIARIPSKSKAMPDKPCRLHHRYMVHELAVTIYDVHWLRVRYSPDSHGEWTFQNGSDP